MGVGRGLRKQDMVSGDRIESEREFFDQEAATLTDEDLFLTESRIRRYRLARPSPLNIPLDSLFAHLLPLEGKHVLDYGCGNGENSILLAACGAQVTAFDLSPVSVAKTRRRAELNGLADRVTVDVHQAGQTGYAPASFDVVVGIAVLHHLHTILPAIYEEVARLLKPGGTAAFIEPVANSPLLRALRSMVPVKRHATEDEIQLVYRHLEPLRSSFSSVEIFHFYCLERLHRVLGKSVRKPLRWLDYHGQQLFPFLRRFYGQVLILARN